MKIEITVSPKGETTIQTKGFVGSTCQQASKFVEETLGMKIQEHLTSEFYQANTISESARQQTGQ